MVYMYQSCIIWTSRVLSLGNAKYAFHDFTIDFNPDQYIIIIIIVYVKRALKRVRKTPTLTRMIKRRARLYT